MQKVLKDYLEDIYAYSAKASEVNRQLAFAGIAILWLYKNPAPSPTILGIELVLPLFLLVISLSLDLIQYLFASLAWTIFYEIKEYQYNQNKLKEKSEIAGPRWITRTIDILFVLKFSATIGAYFELMKFFLPKVSL